MSRFLQGASLKDDQINLLSVMTTFSTFFVFIFKNN